LTEVIHFGNDFISSVASLRSLDAFHWNRWRLSIGITGGIRRNTHRSRRRSIQMGGKTVEVFLLLAIWRWRRTELQRVYWWRWFRNRRSGRSDWV